MREEKITSDANLESRTDEAVTLKSECSSLQGKVVELTAALEKSKMKEEKATLVFESQVNELCASLEKFKVGKKHALIPSLKQVSIV